MLESNTMVKNGMPFVKPALESILPFVKKAIVLLDDSSTDRTELALCDLQKKNKHLVVEKFEHPKELSGLTAVRQRLLKMSSEKWILILDDDEVYPRESMEKLTALLKKPDTKTVVAVRNWFIVNKWLYHKSKSTRWIPRVFKREGVYWGGAFGQETLMRGKEMLWESDDRTYPRDIRYFHFSHMKPFSWRDEYGISYPKYSLEHPMIREAKPDIVKLLKKEVYEKMQEI